MLDGLKTLLRRRAPRTPSDKVPVYVAWDGRVYVKAEELLTNEGVQQRIRDLSDALRKAGVPDAGLLAERPTVEPH